ncbi:MAG: hypothetical protein XXXJIFNMEKO3_03115 [Candidatus Erwinia impunctatus]|nr:hypothetical protein XXXJIFNMEKO_03115 [Culicoides impunctatus]
MADVDGVLTLTGREQGALFVISLMKQAMKIEDAGSG